MSEALSPEAASAEVTAYTGLDLTIDEIRSLDDILTVPRKDTAILSHLRAAHHRLGELPHLPDGENWWDQVRIAMRAAEHDPYLEEQVGTHKAPVAHDRNAVIFWLEHRILPALSHNDSATATGNLTQADSAQALIQNLFSKIGLEARQTRASRDGGVDCVAWGSSAYLWRHSCTSWPSTPG